MDARTILVVMALPAEERGKLRAVGADLLFTGVGKVNASYRLTRRLHEMKLAGRRPIVVNFGTAGSQRHTAGSLVACDRFVQRDMDVTGLGFGAHETPFEDVPRELVFARQFPDLPHARCATSDRFETEGHGDEADVVDMEAYALAKVCHFEGLAFAAVKYVSDGADPTAKTSWEAALDDAARSFASVFTRAFAAP
jgi:adenosylhomocysteine nucleosidase